MKKTFTKTILNQTLDFAIIPHETEFGILYTLWCETLSWKQDFDSEDLAAFLASDDFDFLISDELRKRQKVKNRRIQIRVSESEQAILERKAITAGYKNTASFLRDLALK